MPQTNRSRYSAATKAKCCTVFYDKYVTRCKKLKKEPLPRAEWKKVMMTYGEKLNDHLQAGDAYELPSAMGFLRLTKCRHRIIDLQKGMEKWQQLDEENKLQKKAELVKRVLWETGGYLPKFYWQKRDTKVPNKSYYKIRMVRQNYRKLFQKWKKDPTLMYNLINYRTPIK